MERVKRSIDYLGFVLRTAALTSFVLATSLGGNTWAWTSPQIIGLVVAAVILIGAFAGLAGSLGNLLPGGAAASAISGEFVASLPEDLRGQVLEAVASALHPVFYFGAAASGLAFLLTFVAEELPLASSNREQPKQEASASGGGPVAAATAPASPDR